MFELELVHHFEVEEQVLFPAVRDRLASDGIVDQLIAQHREIESLAGRLAAAPESERIPLLREFGELLSRHIRIEERQLFEEVQEKVRSEDLSELGAQIDSRLRKVCPSSGRLPWDKAADQKRATG